MKIKKGKVSSYQIASWTGFLSVAAGAAATLTGLIIVTVSINLSRVLEFPGLADRAGESILQMFGLSSYPWSLYCLVNLTCCSALSYWQ